MGHFYDSLVPLQRQTLRLDSLGIVRVDQIVQSPQVMECTEAVGHLEHRHCTQLLFQDEFLLEVKLISEYRQAVPAGL
jgi:hypothetical protein